MKLYELTEEFDRIFTDTFNEDVDEDVYFLNEERKKRLDDAALAVDQKIEAIAAVIKNKKAEKDAVAEEIRRLQAKKKRCDNAIKSLREYVVSCLPPERKWKNHLHSVSARVQDSYDIIDARLIPEEYCEIVKEPCMSAIREGLFEYGDEIPGVRRYKKSVVTIR